MSALGLGKSRHPFRRRRAATLTLHFCDEDFASDVRKNQPRRTREYPRTDVRTPHFVPAMKPAPSPLAFTRSDPIGVPGRSPPGVWFGMMRYRSATVAGFHGFPRCLGWDEKEHEHQPTDRTLILERVSTCKNKKVRPPIQASPTVNSDDECVTSTYAQS